MIVDYQAQYKPADEKTGLTNLSLSDLIALYNLWEGTSKLAANLDWGNLEMSSKREEIQKRINALTSKNNNQ